MTVFPLRVRIGQIQKLLIVFSNDRVTEQEILAGHFVSTARRVLSSAEETFLVLHDTSEITGEALVHRKEYKSAKTYLDTALKEGPINLRLILTYANCLEGLGQIAEAIEFLHNMTRIWKNLPEIWIHGYMILSKTKGLRDAAQDWMDEADLIHHGIRNWLDSDSYKNRVK